MYAQEHVHAALHFVFVDDKERLGYWIEQAREQRGLSRQQLAEAMGVAYTTVYMWEAGKKAPSLLSLGPLCEALGVEASLFAELPDVPLSPVQQYLRPAAARAVRKADERTRR